MSHSHSNRQDDRIVTKTPRVALVDDDEGVLDALSALMRKGGYEPSPFTAAGALADALAKGGIFDCIVTDIRMPGI